MPDQNNRLVVMISSTARDLPEHRKEVMDACLRQGMFPVMMEHLPASGSDSVAESLRMVDGVDVYIGVFAFRYGYVPEGSSVSITEMEYERAVERNIPRFIFLTHEDHPLKIADVETGAGAEKLKALRARAEKEVVVSYFKSPAELRANVTDTLSKYRERDLTSFHNVVEIPGPPEPYVAHPYMLLQTRELVGRADELNLLTDWVAKPAAPVFAARIFNVVAIGGMGKSALTWKWFNQIAPQEMSPLAGRMWWSFYESDATFENFVIRALAYVTGRPKEDVEKNTRPAEREDQLLAALNRKPFLIALDGLERILTAYARPDAYRLTDDELDERNASAAAGALGLPASAADSFMGQHRLRKTASPRAGIFLRRLARVQASRVLISTRLYPADLQNSVNGEPLPGTHAHFLRSLSDDDALALWRSFGISGARDQLLDLFHTFENHPLLIQALATEVAGYKRAPGDFDKWRRDNPEFNPFDLPLVQVRAHVLSYALRGLDEAAGRVLQTAAAFRMPVYYDTLAALLVGDGKLFDDYKSFDGKLSELEDRGLMGWDKRANRYDLHPIVRGVAWSGLSEDNRLKTFETLHAHFASFPAETPDLVKTLDDLTVSRELYNALIGLKRYKEALELFSDRLSPPLIFMFGAGRQAIELLELLFSEGPEQEPLLSDHADQLAAIFFLSVACRTDGQLGRSLSLFRRLTELAGDDPTLPEAGFFFAETLYLSGRIREGEFWVRNYLKSNVDVKDELLYPWSLRSFGLLLGARGETALSIKMLERALAISSDTVEIEGTSTLYRAQVALWMGQCGAALDLAAKAQEGVVMQIEKNYVMSKRLHGMARMGLGHTAEAEASLNDALNRARAWNLVEGELPTLVGMAELLRRQGRLEDARELLENVWELAERGPYPLFHADALNVLARIERDEGRAGAATDAAREAFQKAWCDGPPFAYHWAIEEARALLGELGAGAPEMPPFDESRFDPLPDVESDLADESVEKIGGDTPSQG